MEGLLSTVVPSATAVGGKSDNRFYHLKYPSWGSRTHFGVDIWDYKRSPIMPAFDGEVADFVLVNDGKYEDFGNAIILKHPQIKDERGRILHSIYLHFDYISKEVKEIGKKVYAGKTVLGGMGDTGEANNVIHTHFELRWFSDWTHPNIGNIYYYGNAIKKLDASVLNDWEDPETFTVPEVTAPTPQPTTKPLYNGEICSQEGIAPPQTWWQKVVAWLKGHFFLTANACQSATQLGTVSVAGEDVAFAPTPVVAQTTAPAYTTLGDLGITQQEVVPVAVSGLPATGTSSQPIVAKRSDLRVDFDIYRGTEEVSANCGSCASRPLKVGERLRTVLRAQVANTHVKNARRKKKTDSIEGRVWCWSTDPNNLLFTIEEEFAVDDLRKNDDPDEEDFFTVPDVALLQCQAAIDTDDEIEEPHEGKRTKLRGPSDCTQSYATNNCSRIEHFVVLPSQPPVTVTVPQEVSVPKEPETVPAQPDVAGVFYTDPARWDVVVDDATYPRDDAVGTVVFMHSGTVLDVMLVFTSYDILHTDGLDLSLPADQTPLAMCVSSNMRDWVAPQTRDAIVNSPYCSLLPQGDVPAQGTFSAMVSLPEWIHAEMRAAADDPDSGGWGVVVLTQKK